MSIREKSDEAAITAGAVTTGVLAIAGCPVVGAMVLGAIVAAVIDIPFGSITHMHYHGPVRPKSVARIRKIPFARLQMPGVRR